MVCARARKHWYLSVLTAAAAGAIPQSVFSQVPGPVAAAGQLPMLPMVTVTAARDPRTDDEVPNSVSVIDDAEKESKLVNDIRDLTRYEPGVSVRSAPTRFTAAGASTGRDGNAGFTIRGIEGNQILMQTDGIRVPQGFSFGPVAFGRGDGLDLEAYKSVEILRGPASTLYGSDGLAGAVSFITKDPSDYLRPGRGYYGAVKAGYASADSSSLGTVTGAIRAGSLEGLVVVTARNGHETENMGTNDAANSNRTAPYPQDAENRNLP